MVLCVCEGVGGSVRSQRKWCRMSYLYFICQCEKRAATISTLKLNNPYRKLPTQYTQFFVLSHAFAVLDALVHRLLRTVCVERVGRGAVRGQLLHRALELAEESVGISPDLRE